MRIPDISAFYHDIMAALIQDRVIFAAPQEERFTRKKHDPNSPSKACVVSVEFHDKALLKFERLRETYLSLAQSGFLSFKTAIPRWPKEKLFQKDFLRKEFKKYVPVFDWMNTLLLGEHHQSHAVSACYACLRGHSCEYKAVGLAPYAEPQYKDLAIDSIIDVKEDDSFPLHLYTPVSTFPGSQ
ncbi:carbamoyltransferase N-terminal domain-containing protein [Terasakiella pusilla]|uniref:carbamoyltransferase N-terminal domain-containing protein n=1 Tax=Terasakiella pusilla TaxID=64973 RepID=UPI00048A4CB6|nr:carbamoyltransferase N-terminal domain-containing protein [Terasakiella pusilla]